MKEIRNSSTAYYRVADFLIRVIGAERQDLQRSLPSFERFALDTAKEEAQMVDFVLSQEALPLLEDKHLRSDLSPFWGDRFLFEENEAYYITTVQTASGEGSWVMLSDKTFQKSTIYAQNCHMFDCAVLPWFIMLAFGQATIAWNAIAIHASVVVLGGKGYAFLGKSGTGKSTHSRLWLATHPGAKLLNDDNPVVRVLNDGSVRIYGTPWSGKTHCYHNASVPLAAMVRLEQAPENKFEPLKGVGALINLVPSCSALRWNRSLYNRMLNNLELLLKQVNIAKLYCLPNAAAAELCKNKLIETEI